MTPRTWWILGGLGLAACGSPSDDPAAPDAAIASIDGGVDACVPIAPYEPVATPVDLYLMLDQSASMGDAVNGGTKWSQVTAAIESFAGTPSIGLQYFALPAGGGGDSCTAADYATAEVEIASGNLAAVTSSLASHGPSTGAPTAPALQGAVDHAAAWALAHDGHEAAAVLISDGDPTDCDTDLGHLDAIAATATVRTFVIAVGTGLTSLDGVAAAGRTGAAHAIDTTGNVAAQTLTALGTILDDASCGYLPPSFADLGAFSVELDDVAIPHVANLAACSGAGWYYDGGGGPSLFWVCPQTCSDVATGATLEVIPSCE